MMVLYLPINHLVKGGTTLELAIDRAMPLIAVFIVPYLMGSVLFVVMPIWAAWRVKAGEFESYAICVLTVTIISYIIYLTLPTYVNRPPVTGEDIYSRAIAQLYQIDRVYNAAPSGHTYYSVISAIFLIRWKPAMSWLWILLAGLIIASTLLTGQHNVLDLAAGLVLAMGTYYVVRYIRNRWTCNFAS
jgi:membrane-associated phospholipid phosphatase